MKVSDYEKRLRELVAQRLGGEFDEFLALPVKTASQCLSMMDKIHDELSKCDSLMMIELGSQGQAKKAVHPLLTAYKDLQRTMILHYESLGINYKVIPSKLTESTKKGVDENDPMAQYLKGIGV